jgi:hypothetical protein
MRKSNTEDSTSWLYILHGNNRCQQLATRNRLYQQQSRYHGLAAGENMTTSMERRRLRIDYGGYGDMQS